MSKLTGRFGKFSISSAVVAVVLGMAYSADTLHVAAQSSAPGCSPALSQKVQKQGGALESCVSTDSYVVALELYDESNHDLTGLTVSVYDVRGNLIAFQTGFGDHALDYRRGGQKALISLFEADDPSKIGILIRPFLDPNVGLFTSLLFDPASRSVQQIADLPTDAGITPSIDDNGIIRLRSSRYDLDGRLTQYSSEYQLSGGNFVQLSGN